MTRTIVLQTPRLRLTSWLPDDVDELWAVHSDPQTMRFVANCRPEARDETAARLARYIAETEALGYTKWRLTDAAGWWAGQTDRHGMACSVFRL